MSKRQLLILWSLVLLLASGILLVKLGQQNRQTETTKRARGQTLFENFPGEDSTSITIESASEKATLQKNGDVWAVTERGGYPAETKRIQELLRTLDELKITQGIDANAAYFPRFGISTDSNTPTERGVALTFRNQEGKELAGVVLGKTLEAGGPMGASIGGRYIRNVADTSGVYVVSESFPSLVSSPKGWLSESFLSIDKPISIEVTETGNPGQLAWKVTRPDESAPFSLDRLTASEKLDPTTVSPMQNLLTYARFVDVASDLKPSELKERKDARSAKVQTVEGFVYQLTYAPKGAVKPNTTGNAYLFSFQVEAQLPEKRQKPDDEKPEDTTKNDAAFATRLEHLKQKLTDEQRLSTHVFEVSDWTLGGLLKSRADFLQKTRPPQQPTQATTPPLLLPR